MKGLVTFFLLLAGCHVEGEANYKTVLLFPEATNTDHVTLKTPEVVLNQITVCLRSYTDLTHAHTLFSLATPSLPNSFLIFPFPPNNISITINDEDYFFTVDPFVYNWKNLCVTWDSSTGLLQLWINDKSYPRRVTKTRAPIGPQMNIILGQEQDRYGGGFEIHQAFVGEICDVNVWSTALPEAFVRVVLNDQFSYSGNFYNWNSENFTINGAIPVLKGQIHPEL